MKFIYDYVISYACNKNGGLNIGTVKIFRDRKIKTFDDVDVVTDIITGHLGEGATDVSIHNIIYLGRHLDK